MKTLILTALLMVSTNLNAADFGAPGSPEAAWSQYWADHYRQPRQAIRSRNATVSPIYGGGYIVSEPGGHTIYSAPDAFGTMTIHRQGTTTFDW